MKGINTLRYSDIFLAMYSDNGSSCLHRNHSHVLVYMYSGELEIKEHEKVARLHKGDCAFIRKDFSVQLTKQAYKEEQFKAIFLMFTDKFLRSFYSRLEKESLPENARRSKVSDLSPQKWIIRRRLEAAHALIQSGARKVTDICYEVGFKNLSHFSKAYKGLYGCSPAHSVCSMSDSL